MKVLAVDIGASSGRVFEVELANNSVKLNEVHRFNNSIVHHNNDYYWNHLKIFREIETGISKVNDYTSIGIDTWGVDYVLLNDSNVEYGYSYRSNRCISQLNKYDLKKLYFETGTAPLPFNTIFQLDVEKLSGKFLMVADYYVYLLTNKMYNEYTNMKTTQLLNLRGELSKRENIEFNKITTLEKISYKNDKYVTIVASHDTASAFLGSYGYEDGIVISLGTWSVIGLITDDPIVNDYTYENNYSNEGSLFGDNRLVKNTMGSWMIENVLKEFGFDGDYDNLISEIEKIDFNVIVNVDDPRFLNPVSMIDELNKVFVEDDINIPKTMYEYAKIIYDSMLEKHVEIIKKMLTMSNEKIKLINVIGGGAKNKYFCRRLMSKLKMPMYIGPFEATVVGNAFAQYIAFDVLKKEELKTILINSNLVEELNDEC